MKIFWIVAATLMLNACGKNDDKKDNSRPEQVEENSNKKEDISDSEDLIKVIEDCRSTGEGFELIEGVCKNLIMGQLGSLCEGSASPEWIESDEYRGSQCQGQLRFKHRGTDLAFIGADWGYLKGDLSFKEELLTEGEHKVEKILELTTPSTGQPFVLELAVELSYSVDENKTLGGVEFQVKSSKGSLPDWVLRVITNDLNKNSELISYFALVLDSSISL